MLSDLYLPKHANGRNKGYGFATFASSESLSLALQQPKHVVDGITVQVLQFCVSLFLNHCSLFNSGYELGLCTPYPTACLGVQVKRAGPRPPNHFSSSPATPVSEHVSFGQGPRIYVGGVHESLTETSMRDHFARWGIVSDVYFPGAQHLKRSNYCFVTFDNRNSAQRACSESERTLNGWVSFTCLHLFGSLCNMQFCSVSCTLVFYVLMQLYEDVLMHLYRACMIMQLGFHPAGCCSMQYDFVASCISHSLPSALAIHCTCCWLQ